MVRKRKRWTRRTKERKEKYLNDNDGKKKEEDIMTKQTQQWQKRIEEEINGEIKECIFNVKKFEGKR